MLSFISLPYEVLANIVTGIDFNDLYNLGRTCHALNYLLTEESISKVTVQTKIPYSLEARSALKVGEHYAEALRRAAKRRDALATASPFAAATIGFCDTYLYYKGVLCYTLDDRIRVLDLHHSGYQEIVISIPDLLRDSLSTEICQNSNGLFQILYYSNCILSCLYRSTGLHESAWLIAVNIKTKRTLLVEALNSTDKIFVRHNNRYVYYGTHSEIGLDGFKKWVIHGYDFKMRTWFDQKVHLPDMVGSEIGSTVCFEIHNEYFYALSNQTSFEVEEIDWTSFYHCVRFPLASPYRDLVEKTEDKQMWRRQHQEGPIDDRWTSLRLDEDETTGELKIIESRKEWYLGSSRSLRTYYKTDIVFPSMVENQETESIYTPDTEMRSISSSDSIFSSSQAPSSTESVVISEASSSASTSTNTASEPSTFDTLTSNANTSKILTQDLSGLPDDPLLRLLQPGDNPHHMEPPRRLAQNTHPGNDGSIQPTFTLSKSRVRHYHTCANTFLDLVDDPLPSDWEGKQRLRLRAGSRKLNPPLKHEAGPKAGLLREPSPVLTAALQELYRDEAIAYWPPAQDPNDPDEEIDALYRLLNPPTHLGYVEGTADSRSIIYVTGAPDKPQAIIFLSFDPAIKLAGVKRWPRLRNWGGMCRKGVGEGPHVDGRAGGCEVGVTPAPAFTSVSAEGTTRGRSSADHDEGRPAKKRRCVDVEENDRVISMDREKGKGRADNGNCFSLAAAADVRATSFPGGDASLTETGREGRCARLKSWAWKESAMYLDVGLGFYFGLDKVAA